MFKFHDKRLRETQLWFTQPLRPIPTHLCEYGEGLSRRPLAHPELREDVLELFVVDYVVPWRRICLLWHISKCDCEANVCFKAEGDSFLREA